jgi:hypothetical protein
VEAILLLRDPKGQLERSCDKFGNQNDSVYQRLSVTISKSFSALESDVENLRRITRLLGNRKCAKECAKEIVALLQLVYPY